MRVRLRLFGTLRRLSAPETPGLWEGEVPQGSTIRAILEQLGAGVYEAYAAAVNNEPASLDTAAAEGDEITVVTPMGGGASTESDPSPA